MGRLKNYLGFSDKYGELLSLSQSQIAQIEDIEYEYHKNHRWNRLPEPENAAETHVGNILKCLRDEQRATYFNFIKDEKRKREEQKKEKFEKALERQRVRLQRLNLSDHQLEEYVRKTLNITSLMHKAMERARSVEEMDFATLWQQVYEEEIYSIFTDAQSKHYKEIKEQEELSKAEAEQRWKIQHEKGVFKQQYGIELRDEQAAVVFSKDFNQPLKDETGAYYAEFEMKEKEQDWYKMQLTPAQFAVYQRYHEAQLKYRIAALVAENDGRDHIELHRTKNYLNYYIAQVLPALVEARKRIEASLTEEQKQLIEDVRRHCAQRLKIEEEKYDREHKRHYRGYKPNAQKTFELNQKIETLQVNRHYLYRHESAKKLMTVPLQSVVAGECQKLQKQFDALKDFQIKNYEETGGTYGGGWMIKIEPKDGEEDIEGIGILLLYPDLQQNMELIAPLD